MKPMIVTICNTSYSVLLESWLLAIRKLTELPITVLCLNGFQPAPGLPCDIVRVVEEGNPFSSDLPDHACFEKFRVFEHIPNADQILFIDLDVFILRTFWEELPYFEISNTELILAPDLFVGYKEKMEDEFCPYDSDFRMRYTEDGKFFYFNTGVFFATRQAHAEWFRRFLVIWKDYLKMTGRRPSIFDQNIINYCIIRFELPVYFMPITNNCLRQYETFKISDGHLLLNEKEVSAYHFNGGGSTIKLERWKKMVREMEVSHGST